MFSLVILRAWQLDLTRPSARGKKGAVRPSSDAETLEPARDEFVLRALASREEVFALARRLGSVERIASAPELCLLRLTPEKTSRETWQAATRALADAALLPVLYDQDGMPHYPTGEVTIRFELAPSDSELRSFCDTHGLRLLRRNEYAEQQIVCEPLEAVHQFLPDLVAHLGSQPRVRRAWANTLSRFRRAAE